MQLSLLDIATLDFSLHKISKENVCTVRLRNFFYNGNKKNNLLCTYSGWKKCLCYFWPTFHFHSTNVLTKKKKRKCYDKYNDKRKCIGGKDFIYLMIFIFMVVYRHISIYRIQTQKCYTLCSSLCISCF